MSDSLQLVHADFLKWGLIPPSRSRVRMSSSKSSFLFDPTEPHETGDSSEYKENKKE